MCTASWWRHTRGYSLLFNRDERHGRAVAEPPQVRGGLLSPRDPQGTGTWISANTHGLSICLLNAYQLEAGAVVPAQPRSRGLLVREVGPCAHVVALAAALACTDLSPYPPFHLLAVDLTRAHLWTWDGRVLDDGPATAPVTTSSHRTAEVQTWRHAYFARLRCLPPARRHSHYHLARIPGRTAYGPCMDRDDARTVSLTEVTVSPETIAMRYASRERHAPFAPPVTLTLSRT